MLGPVQQAAVQTQGHLELGSFGWLLCRVPQNSQIFYLWVKKKSHRVRPKNTWVRTVLAHYIYCRSEVCLCLVLGLDPGSEIICLLFFQLYYLLQLLWFFKKKGNFFNLRHLKKTFDSLMNSWNFPKFANIVTTGENAFKEDIKEEVNISGRKFKMDKHKTVIMVIMILVLREL